MTYLDAVTPKEFKELVERVRDKAHGVTPLSAEEAIKKYRVSYEKMMEEFKLWLTY